MNQLQVTEHENQRVLTTSQLAESFGTESKIISRNFQRNAERYKLGKHYFSLSGEDLQRFKGSRPHDDNLKYTSVLYLWTEKGAWLHAKSLNNNEAWQAYEKLIDEYYYVINREQPNTRTLLLETALEHEKKIEAIEQDVDYLKNNMRIDGAQEYELNQKGKNKVIKSLQGYRSPAYQEMSGKIFSRFWRDFKQHFTIPRYTELPKRRFDEALEFIDAWQPDTSTRLEIQNINRQQTMKEVI